jgi:hypothetical protein
MQTAIFMQWQAGGWRGSAGREPLSATLQRSYHEDMAQWFPGSQQNSARIQSGIQRWAEIGLIFLVFFIFGGDPAPHVNEPHYLCRFKHYWQPEWASGDLFLESPDAHFVVVVTLGWLTKLLSLPATAWTLRIATWLALAWAWQRLSFRLVPRPWCAILAASIWTFAIEQGNLAGEWVIGGFEAKCIAYVFVLLALRDLVDNCWNRAWILFGCGSAFHVLVGGWSVIVSLVVWTILRSGGWGRSAAQPPAEPPPLVTMLPGLITGGAIAMLGLVPTLALNWNTPPEIIEQANYIYTFVRLPHHLALLHNGPDWLIERAGRHAVVFAIWVLLTLRLWKHRPEAFHGPLGRIILFATGALTLAACGLAIEVALQNHPYIAAKLQRFYWYRLNDVTAAAVAAWLLLDWIVELLARRKPLGAVLLLATLAVVGGRMAHLAFNRVVSPVAPADRKMVNDAHWIDVCDWVRDNTSPTALFLVPRESHSFKWRTGRPEIVTRKDIPQDAASMVQWHERMKDVFRPRGEPPLFGSPANPDATRIGELADRYGADYLIIDNSESLSLPFPYSNDTYTVYDLRATRTATPVESAPNVGSN